MSPNPNSAIDNAYNDSSDGEIVMILVMMKIKALLITTIMKISTMILPEKSVIKIEIAILIMTMIIIKITIIAIMIISSLSYS